MSQLYVCPIVCLAVDKGIRGAMVPVAIRGGLRLPLPLPGGDTWSFRSMAAMRKAEDLLRWRFLDVVARCRPTYVATEEATSIPGRRFVGVAQAEQNGWLVGWCREAGLELVRVRGQGPKRAENMRRGLQAEVGELTEHEWDAVAIAAAADTERRLARVDAQRRARGSGPGEAR